MSEEIQAPESMDLTWPKILAVVAGCLGVGYILGRRFRLRFLSKADINALPPYDGKSDIHEIEKIAEVMEDFKMVLVVRNDLKMGKGKIAAQCSHATLGLYKKLFYRAPKALQRWEMCGQVKVVTRVESEEELLLLQRKHIPMINIQDKILLCLICGFDIQESGKDFEVTNAYNY